MQNGKISIVTASDSGYFDLLRDLVCSIRDKPEGADFPISILDVGLDADQLEWLEPRVQNLVKVGWDIDFPQRREMPEHFRAMVARPFLPKHLPDYDGYIWLDADAWVQKWDAVATYLSALENHGFAITPELDRSYAYIYNLGNARRLVHNVLERGFGKQAADAFGALPILNSGGFCIKRISPIWKAWQDVLATALQNHPHHMIEQTALNVVLYSQKGLPQFLPSLCNWMCVHAAPVYDPPTGMLVEPFLPHRPLEIVHLGGQVKQYPELEIRTTDGSTRKMSLRYPGPSAAQSC